MARTDIDRKDAMDVFLASQDMPVVTPASVADNLGRINTAYARQILAELTRRGLLYDANPDSLSTHEGYSWDQDPMIVFNENWPDTEEKKMTDTKPKPPTAPAATRPGNRICKCGCGSQVEAKTSLYRPGHDARHASQIAKQAATLTEPEAHDLITKSLPTDALRIKATRQADAITAKAQAKTAAAAKKESEKVLAQAGKTSKVVAGFAKVGRWQYPARKTADGHYQVNDRRDGTGSWKPLDKDKFSTEPVQG